MKTDISDGIDLLKCRHCAFSSTICPIFARLKENGYKRYVPSFACCSSTSIACNKFAPDKNQVWLSNHFTTFNKCFDYDILKRIRYSCSFVSVDDDSHSDTAYSFLLEDWINNNLYNADGSIRWAKKRYRRDTFSKAEKAARAQSKETALIMGYIPNLLNIHSLAYIYYNPDTHEIIDTYNTED